jgi:hypothetical protein
MGTTLLTVVDGEFRHTYTGDSRGLRTRRVAESITSSHLLLSFDDLILAVTPLPFPTTLTITTTTPPHQ